MPQAPEDPRQMDVAAVLVLDQTIDAKIRNCNENLVRAYLELASCLKEMKATKGYMLLGYGKWESYLASKTQFARTYLSYLCKLANAGDLSEYLDQGMTPSKLIAYAQSVAIPEKIPEVIEATWHEIKDQPLRSAAKAIKDFVAEHPEEYLKPGKVKTYGRQKTYWKALFKRRFEKLSPEEKFQFLDGLREFQEEHGMQ